MAGALAALGATAAPYLLTAALAAAGGGWGAWQLQDLRWQGRYDSEALARAEEEALDRASADALLDSYRQDADQAAGDHAAALAVINTQLGDARAHIAQISDRQCLGAGTVGLLNAIGTAPGSAADVRAAASDPAGAAQAAAGSAGDPAGEGYASERDVAEFIAICRARYGEVSGQLNEILDLDLRRGHADFTKSGNTPSAATAISPTTTTR